MSSNYLILWTININICKKISLVHKINDRKKQEVWMTLEILVQPLFAEPHC